MASKKFDCDVVIAGGGLVGLALAVRLGQLEYKTELIDNSANFLQAEPTDLGLRVSAISPGSEDFLKSLGVWSSLSSQTLAAYSEMCVWDANDTAQSERALRFHAADLGQTHLGHIIYNQSMSWALIKQLQTLDTVTLHTNTAITDVTIDQSSRRAGIKVNVASDDNLVRSTQLLVGADGARSTVRQLTQFDVVRHSYQQRGVVCTVSCGKSHNDTAWQRFLPDGPLAFLPLKDKSTCSVVWSTSDSHAERVTQIDERAFEKELTLASDHVLGELTLKSQRASFPLSLQRATRYVKPGVALIGDAAHVIHPLAGQGVNLGFADVKVLTDVLQNAKSRGDNLGDTHALRRYERSRKLATRKMQLTTHGLQKLFAQSNSAVAGIRSLGLGGVNAIPHIKHYLARQALL